MNRATTILIFCVAVLLGLGMVSLYSASMNLETARTEAGTSYLRQQLVWCVFGLAGCAVAATTDYRRWRKIAPWLLLISALMLAAVFVPALSHVTKGARRWIALPFLPRFQPSELAKLSVILFLASYCAKYRRQMDTFKRGLVIPGVVTLAILGLIFFEPDRGCTILLAAVAGTMLVVAGVRLLYLATPTLAGASFLAWSLWHDPVRRARILAWWNPEDHKQGVGFQAYKAMLAFGSGGWTGLGLGNSRQKLGILPEHHTDFIFPIMGEEMGLVTTMSVLLLFVALVICGIYISRRAGDTYGFLLGTGLTFMIGIQAIINMGVVTNLLPNKGMPLPFISYGGSNLLLMMVSVGLLLSISRSAIVPVSARNNPFDPTPTSTDE